MSDDVNAAVQPIASSATSFPLMLGAPPLTFTSGVQLTGDLLLKACPGTKRHDIADGCAAALTRWLPVYGITDLVPVVVMLGQMAEESAYWKTLTEYASGHEYEGRRDLGNVERGWGVKYKGRGPIQITGHVNYAHYGPEIVDPETGAKGVDLLTHPERAAQPDIGCQIAIRYCLEHHIVTIARSIEYALDQKIELATRKVNGGLNGLASRSAMTHTYLRLLSAATES